MNDAQPTTRELYRAACDFADMGQPVFPCIATGVKAKAPLTRRGLHDGSLFRADIKAWWSRHRDAAIGIPTGFLWDVLDVDTKNDADGRVHLPYLQRLGLLDGCQRLVRTPSGGWHLYFRASAATTNRASSTLGLDVRGKGGYVLAPPSWIDTTEYAGSYEQMDDPVGATDDPLMWDLIVSALVPLDVTSREPVSLLPSERRASVGALREWVSVRQPGERNNALHWAVCRCIDNNIDPHELVEAAIVSGLAEEEVLLTIRSAMKRAGIRVEDMDSEAEALFPDTTAPVEESSDMPDPRDLFPDE